VELGGHVIPKGAMVWPVLGSANHDETRFPEPERFDITRDASGHVAFGSGIHFCLGAPLARLEARVAMEEMLPLLPELRIAERPLEYIDAFFLRGLKALPIAGPEAVPVSAGPVGLRAQWSEAATAVTGAVKASYRRLTRRPFPYRS
jgi:cytochrome P450